MLKTLDLIVLYRLHVTPILSKTQNYFYKFKMASSPTKKKKGTWNVDVTKIYKLSFENF